MSEKVQIESVRQTVQRTWSQVMGHPVRAATLLYSELFRIDPSIQYLFKGDLDAQKMQLMAMFNVAVRGLDDWDNLAPLIVQLGRRHRGYQVRIDHYDTMGLALRGMIKQVLGDEYTPEVEEGWIVAYSAWADTMKKAAAE